MITSLIASTGYFYMYTLHHWLNSTLFCLFLPCYTCMCLFIFLFVSLFLCLFVGIGHDNIPRTLLSTKLADKSKFLSFSYSKVSFC